jgi:hypothetical protein
LLWLVVVGAAMAAVALVVEAAQVVTAVLLRENLRAGIQVLNLGWL